MSAEPLPHEKRQHKRRWLQTTANVMVAGRSPLEVRTSDISVGGLGIVAPANPPQNLIVTVRLALPMPGSKLVPIEVTGRVVYSVLSRQHGGFSIGLSFMSVSPQVLQVIDAYVRL